MQNLPHLAALGLFCALQDANLAISLMRSSGEKEGSACAGHCFLCFSHFGEQLFTLMHTLERFKKHL